MTKHGTKIEWTHIPGYTGETWNPIVGCSVISPGCTNCYAMRLAGTRLKDNPNYAYLTEPSKAGPVWNGRIGRNSDRAFAAPLLWKKPRSIFVNSMGDLFHEDVPDYWIDQVFAIMAICPQHIFIVLTKRAERMREYMTANTGEFCTGHACGRVAGLVEDMRTDEPRKAIGPVPWGNPGDHWWPLPHVWLGVSAEDQTRAEERIPPLLETPAAGRFISCEPLLGPLDLSPWLDNLDWAIIGGESGGGARPMHPEWARSLRDQCKAAGVPFFMKQMAKKAPIPAELLVREWPTKVEAA